jgi:acetyltransferase-like isoleucine patch superfamily enzyme
MHSDITWPRDVSIGRGVVVAVSDGGRFIAGDRLVISKDASITVKYGQLISGQNLFVGQGTVIVARESVVIGNDVMIAEHVTIRDQSHRIGGPEVTARNGFETAPINIGDNVWIGAKVTITKGVTIGNNCVIGANSVVTRDIPNSVVAAGVPARVLRVINSDCR